MVNVKLGYYVRDSGNPDDPHRYHFYYMADEPPLGQHSLRSGGWERLEMYGLYDGRWVLLVDGWYLMDKLMDGDPEYDGPLDFDELPEGVPPFEAPPGDQVPQYIFLDGEWKPLIPPFESERRS